MGDCLNVLRDNVPAECIDLIYIDPPFNSKRDYNIFFDDKEIQSQRMAFEDTWSLKNIQESLAELHTIKTEPIYDLLHTYQQVAPHAFPYLVMMAVRLVELHRVLKRTGSFYLHCDPTMSHYLKTLCDLIFGRSNFRNEIIWRRTSSHNDSKRWMQVHDVILFYSKGKFIWNPVFLQHDPKYVEKFYRYHDDRGKYRLHEIIRTASMGARPNLAYEYKGYTPQWGWRMIREKVEKLDGENRIEWGNSGRPYLKRYLHEQNGTPISSVITDIPPISALDDDRVGYPTQKPKELLERIIKASSDENCVILDAFCGCGTTISASEGLKRKWIGIDISPVAISLIKRRLSQEYGNLVSKYEVRGVPADICSAVNLWKENPNAFQDWWLTELEVFSTTYGSKGPDKGIDGIGLYSVGKTGGEPIKVAFQVKGGKVQSKDVDALFGILPKHKCSAGVLLSIHEPSKPMMETVAGSGFIKAGLFTFPKLQILTLKDFCSNKKPVLPDENITFRASAKKSPQTSLELQA